jgi:hypothetical protein
VERDNDSFAETVARALGISIRDLRVLLAQGRIGRALLDRFTEPRIATDNAEDSIRSAPGRSALMDAEIVARSIADRMR